MTKEQFRELLERAISNDGNLFGPEVSVVAFHGAVLPDNSFAVEVDGEHFSIAVDNVQEGEG